MNSRVRSDPPRWWPVLATFLVALALMLIPYPESLQFARPDWVTLALFYWCITLPRRIGVGAGWLLGLALDLIHHALFAQHAIGKMLIALIAASAYPRLRQYHLWQQCMVIALLAAIDIGIVLWVYHLTDGIAIHPAHWLAALTTAALWPLARFALRRVRVQTGA